MHFRDAISFLFIRIVVCCRRLVYVSQVWEHNFHFYACNNKRPMSKNKILKFFFLVIFFSYTKLYIHPRPVNKQSKNKWREKDGNMQLQFNATSRFCLYVLGYSFIEPLCLFFFLVEQMHQVTRKNINIL